LRAGTLLVDLEAVWICDAIAYDYVRKLGLRAGPDHRHSLTDLRGGATGEPVSTRACRG
jgi:hypothetical protein